MKKFLCTILAMVMMVSLVACGASQPAPAPTPAPSAPAASTTEPAKTEPAKTVEKVTMKLATTTAADPNLGEYQAIAMIEELVEKYSEGSIDVELYPASQLGSNVEFCEGVALGEIESCTCGFDGLGNYAPVANALCMPYLFTSNADAMSKIFADTDIHKALDKEFENINMKIVGYINRPFRVVCNTVRPVKTPADMKGLVLRSPSSPVNTAINSAMGAEPVTISWSEVYTSMSQGACTAVENAIVELHSIKLDQQCKYFSETNHTGGLIPIIVGKAWYDSLDPSQQAAIDKACKEVTEWRTNSVEAEVDQVWKDIEAAGCEVLRADEIDIEAFREATKDVAAEFIKKGDFTQEFYDALKG